MQSLPTNYSEEKERVATPTKQDALDTSTSQVTIITSHETSTDEKIPSLPSQPRLESTWLNAFKQILPIYIATHIAFLLLTYLATLFAFTPKNFSVYALPLSTLVQSWDRWD